MKRIQIKLTLMFAIALLIPALSMAQDIFDKYSDNAEVTYVSIKPKMFQMIAKMGINVDDPEAKAYMDMVQSITSFKTIVTENKNIGSEIAGWVKSKSSTLEELMEVKDEGSNVKFYVKEGSDANHVKELLIFVNGVDKLLGENKIEINGETRKFETVVVSLTGNIDLNEISKLTDKMNIPGGKQIKKQK